MQFLEKIKKSIFSLIILILLIISFFVFKFALQKEKIYTPKMVNNQIFTDFEVEELIEGKKVNFDSQNLHWLILFMRKSLKAINFNINIIK